VPSLLAWGGVDAEGLTVGMWCRAAVVIRAGEQSANADDLKARAGRGSVGTCCRCWTGSRVDADDLKIYQGMGKGLSRYESRCPAHSATLSTII
jgi:hypothetical protein